MSRCVKDLRELICISRLSIRHDESSADDTYENDGDISNDEQDEQVVLFPRYSVPNSDLSRGLCQNIIQHKAPSSGQASASGHFASFLSRKRSDDVVVGRPKSAVGGVRRPVAVIESGLENEHVPLVDNCTHRRSNSKENPKCNDVLIENILRFIDASVISDWLERSNNELDIIVNWLKRGYNFIEFANFMLTRFHYAKRKELVDMEVSFILSEFELAFNVGIRDKNVKIRDLQTLLQVVLAEYPARLHGRKGSFILLMILLTFCCGKNEAYKKLLSDVKLSTSNKHYIQWLLAMRAFSLVNLSNGIIGFYKQLTSLENHQRSGAPREVNDCGETLVLLWLTDAIELGFVEVFKCFVEFFMQTFASFSRDQKRIIISKAITAGSGLILRYLIEKIFPEYDVNEPFETGNTALHIAVNNGRIAIAELLIEKGANVNVPNVCIDNATAMHLAVINGQEEMLKLLINHGADVSLKMGPAPGVTAKQLAIDIGQLELLKCFP